MWLGGSTGCKKKEIPIGTVHTHPPALILDKGGKVLHVVGDWSLSKADNKAARKDKDFNCVLTRIEKDVLLTCVDYSRGKKEQCASVVAINVPVEKTLVKKVAKQLGVR